MRRSEEEMMVRILEVSNSAEGANITRIVYSANLNFKSASFLIKKLLSNGLLEEISENDRRRFRTTEKGLEVIKRFRDFSDMFK